MTWNFDQHIIDKVDLDLNQEIVKENGRALIPRGIFSSDSTKRKPETNNMTVNNSEYFPFPWHRMWGTYHRSWSKNGT